MIIAGFGSENAMNRRDSLSSYVSTLLTCLLLVLLILPTGLGLATGGWYLDRSYK